MSKKESEIMSAEEDGRTPLNIQTHEELTEEELRDVSLTTPAS
jgi:hypothetical protein